MADKKFKAGDVVRLKSGGPKMTAGGYDTLGRVICEWFDGQKPMSGTYNEESLELAEAASGTRPISRA